MFCSVNESTKTCCMMILIKRNYNEMMFMTPCCHQYFYTDCRNIKRHPFNLFCPIKKHHFSPETKQFTFTDTVE